MALRALPFDEVRIARTVHGDPAIVRIYLGRAEGVRVRLVEFVGCFGVVNEQVEMGIVLRHSAVAARIVTEFDRRLDSRRRRVIVTRQPFSVGLLASLVPHSQRVGFSGRRYSSSRFISLEDTPR